MDRILGRTGLHNIYHPKTGALIVESGVEISEALAQEIEDAGIDEVEIRSVLTCESKSGVCERCYGRNLASNRMVQRGEAVGVVAAQSIGEPGTQLTLRTFHVGGTASNIAAESQIRSKYDGIIMFDEVKTVQTERVDDETGETIKVDVIVGRSGDARLLDAKTNLLVTTYHLPYSSRLYLKDGQKIAKNDLICEWDPYNALILTDIDGTVEFSGLEEGITYKEESDEQTGYKEKVISDSRDKNKIPVIRINNNKGELLKEINLPVGARLAVEDGQKVKGGAILCKIPRSAGKTRDITGGLPRVTELFEARNPSNPAVVSEIDGVVAYGGIKRGNREISVESKEGEIKRYLVSLSKHILVQDNDFIKAGQPLSDGAITPQDILRIQGPTAVQQYILNGIQEVYRLQGVKINDKHIEIIIRQMMQKVEIIEPGDTIFLEGEAVEKWEFTRENDAIFDKKVVIEAGDSTVLKNGQVVSLRELRDENSKLKRQDLTQVQVRDAITATMSPLLQGITKASLGTQSFLSAASFQETTKVLNEAAISGKVDELRGLKENVIVGHLIPAGTGLRTYENIVVGSKEEYQKLVASKEEDVDVQTEHHVSSH
jgi:DNA-directed RNA polymerase subunit beta'